MLDSGSALLRSRQLIRRNRALQSYAHLRELQKNKIKISTTHHYAAKSIGVADQGVDVVVRRSTDLLKWSVSLIAQSLAPLKRKDEYYSLIFIKILKTRGFLDLKKKPRPRNYCNKERARLHRNYTNPQIGSSRRIKVAAMFLLAPYVAQHYRTFGAVHLKEGLRHIASNWFYKVKIKLVYLKKAE